MTTDLRLGVLGCGFFGRALATAAAGLPGCTVALVADLDPAAAAATAAALGATATTPDRLFDAAALDGVLIATPNDRHVDPVRAACAAGLPVFVEKPMALTPADCELMRTAAADAGVPLVVGHILRTLPASGRLRALLADGRLGTVLAASGGQTRWLPTDGDPGDWWKRDPARTGGELLHEIHVLDLLCWLLGEPEDVTGSHGADDTHLLLRYPGHHAHHHLSRVNRRARWGLTIDGSAATAHLDLRAATLTVLTADGDREVSGIFDEPVADDSLRAAATRPAAYHRPGRAADPWLHRAIELELAETRRIFLGATGSPLLDAPARAVEVAHRSLAGAA